MSLEGGGGGGGGGGTDNQRDENESLYSVAE